MKKKIKKIIAKLPFYRKRIQRKKQNEQLIKKIEKLEKKNKKLKKSNRNQHRTINGLNRKLEAMFEDTKLVAVESSLSNNKISIIERKLAAYNKANGMEISNVEQKMIERDAFLKDERPLVSIIMLNRNGKHNLEILMNSFNDHIFYDNFELICVDNASTDDSLEYLESWKDKYNIKIIKNDENMSFSAANNKGVAYSKGEYLLFLNNDVEVTDGWLDELLIAINTAENPGAIGAKLIYPQVPAGTINAKKSYSIQHNGIAFMDTTRLDSYFIQPYNMGNGKLAADRSSELVERIGVTAAVLLMTRKAFDEIGGYDEKYIYGYEDVDLCLKLSKAGYKNYYCPTCIVFHYEFGTQSTDASKDVKIRRIHNMNVFRGKWQSYLSRKILEDKLNNTHLYSEKSLKIGLVVTEHKADTTAGDYFTAMELANSLKKLGYDIKYLSRKGHKDWYDVGVDVDVVISLLDAYDITKMYNTKNDLITIAWARNWFDRWCEKPFFNDFDLVFASSKTACEYVENHSKQKAILFPIATNADRFNADIPVSLTKEEKKLYRSDYVFTGSYWNVKREIIDYLDPAEIPFKCKIYGANWEQIDKFKDCACGFLLYDDMPKVYRRTKIVIDDANHVTKEYGAVNSRVFDALAAGVLVLTNGIIGAKETFNGMLPCFENKEEFNEKLLYYLENDEERQELVDKLREFVLENHTYDVRAKYLKDILMQFTEDKLDDRMIDICGPMPDNETKKFWGDYHFSVAMKKEFEKLGYKVNILPRDRWYDRSMAKYKLVLRGPKDYYPAQEEGRKYIMWNISHPEAVPIEEYNLFDFVYFASKKAKDEIGAKIKPESDVLLQCVDEEVMTYEDKPEKEYELLFVGNSRFVFRKILKDLLPTEHKLTVYGREWKKFPVYDYVVSKYIANDKVGQAYHDAKILLNDHWDDMREYGIVSNRLFDALAVGAFVISDYMPEIDEIFKGAVVTYTDREDLKAKIDYYLEHDDEREALAKKGQELVLKEHLFSVRCKHIIDNIHRV